MGLLQWIRWAWLAVPAMTAWQKLVACPGIWEPPAGIGMNAVVDVGAGLIRLSGGGAANDELSVLLEFAVGDRLALHRTTVRRPAGRVNPSKCHLPRQSWSSSL